MNLEFINVWKQSNDDFYALIILRFEWDLDGFCVTFFNFAVIVSKED